MLLILICNKINYSYIATELWHYDLFVLICQLANQKVFGFFFLSKQISISGNVNIYTKMYI